MFVTSGGQKLCTRVDLSFFLHTTWVQLAGERGGNLGAMGRRIWWANFTRNFSVCIQNNRQRNIRTDRKFNKFPVYSPPTGYVIFLSVSMYQDKCIFFCRLPIIFVGGGKTDREI
jgi:hypothetical protein